MRRAFSCVVPLAVLAILVLAGCAQESVLVRPYLQNPTQHSVTLQWIMSRPEPGLVRYGPAGRLTEQVGPVTGEPIAVHPQATRDEPTAGESHVEYLYKVTLDQLSPGTRYVYRVLAGGAAFDGVFKTAPAGAEPFTFVAYGDTRSDFATHGKVASGIREARPDFIVHTGDITDTGAYVQYRPQFFQPLGDVIDHIPIFTALGNHDGFWNVYRALFTLPAPVRWYSFTYANAHFFALDSTAGPSNRPAMLQWLDTQLADSTADWKIVYYHHPSYDISPRRTAYGRKDLLPLLRKHGVDMVITGHCHGYQRMHPLYTPQENEHHPIMHIVAAGGGASLHTAGYSNFAASVARAYCFTLLQIDGRRLTGQTIGLDGEPFDRFEIDKTAGRFAEQYLASALPETEFDSMHDHVARQIARLRVPNLPQPGQPVSLSFPFTAPPDSDIELTISIDNTRDYGMNRLKVSIPAGQTEQLAFALRARNRIRTRGSALQPAVSLVCTYQVAGGYGRVYGGAVRYAPAAPADAPDDQQAPVTE